jgi:hypothetical protein
VEWIRGEEQVDHQLMRFSVLPETLRSLVGDGSIRPPAICMSPIALFQQRRVEKRIEATGEAQEPVERPSRKKVCCYVVHPNCSLILLAVSTTVRVHDTIHTGDPFDIYFRLAAVFGILLYTVSRRQSRLSGKLNEPQNTLLDRPERCVSPE